MEPPVFEHHHRVRYAECTLGNHIYHARYLDLLDAARGEFFRALGHPLGQLQEEDIVLPVVEYRLRYLSPARYDEELTITVTVIDLRRVRVSFGHRVTGPDGRLILEAESTYACTSAQGHLRRLPTDLVGALQPWLKNLASPTRPATWPGTPRGPTGRGDTPSALAPSPIARPRPGTIRRSDRH
jgi:acyl-CoA thioester hydrolase